MRLFAQCNLAYAVDTAVEAIAKVHVLDAPDQRIVAETLTLSDGARLATVAAADGTRLLRGEIEGAVDLAYTALVDVAPRAPIPADARQHRWDELSPDTLEYLLPSRFCPSDTFGRFVAREFDADAPGGARVAAILDWIHASIDYLHGVSNAETTAERTFVDRAGVCRDFTHLGITLCRAAGIPARAVGAYAWRLEPADFHAVMEVYLGGQWWLADPTRLAPGDGLIRIATGRDAADIAFLTTGGGARAIAMTVSVAKIGD
ncbi:MAG: transglutaminase family protein [Sphingomonadaceae bacterium]|nr:transglutaminase family protein [Sphingomonadaceae bacterium]